MHSFRFLLREASAVTKGTQRCTPTDLWTRYCTSAAAKAHQSVSSTDAPFSPETAKQDLESSAKPLKTSDASPSPPPPSSSPPPASYSPASHPLPYSSIPLRPHTPLITTLKDIYALHKGYVHKNVLHDARTMGDIYRWDFGHEEVVYISDPDAVEHIFKMDSRVDTPKIGLVPPFVAWKEENGKTHGLLTTNTADWRRMRRAVNKNLASPASVHAHIDELGSIADQFIQRIHALQMEKMGNTAHSRGRQEEGVVVKEELFKWAFESIGHVIFDQRFGAISSNTDPSIVEFAKAAHDAFSSMSKIFHLPPNVAKKLRPIEYKKHSDSWHILYGTGVRLLNTRIQEIEEKVAAGEAVSGFLAGLLSNETITRDEIYSNVIDLMIAALETTVSATQWILHEFLGHPQAAGKLQQEVYEVLGEREEGEQQQQQQKQQVTVQQIADMRYLKAFVKEALRMHPPVIMSSKTTQEDIVLSGYHIPNNTRVMINIMVMARSERQFHQADTFIPERWLGDNKQSIHKYAFLPFSHGIRGCIGRRFAEFQLYLLTAKLVQYFNMQLVGPTRRSFMDGIVFPHPPLEIHFSRRK